MYPRTRLIYNDAYSRATARRLGGFSFVRTFSHLRYAQPTEKKRERKKMNGEGGERASREWRMNYSTGSSRLPRR